MSSLVRRIQKSIAKGQGFYRSFFDGKIYNSDNQVAGIGPEQKHWPKVSAPTKIKKGT